MFWAADLVLSVPRPLAPPILLACGGFSSPPVGCDPPPAMVSATCPFPREKWSRSGEQLDPNLFVQFQTGNFLGAKGGLSTSLSAKCSRANTHPSLRCLMDVVYLLLLAA